MKKQLILLIITILPLGLLAQNVYYIKYSYDNSGNRVHREFFCGAPDNGGGGTQGGGNGGGNSNRPAKIVPSEETDYKASEFDFAVSPNPSDGKYKVSLLHDNLLGSTLDILDEKGKSIHSLKLDNKDFWIDITPFANGVYYFYLRDEKQSKTRKVIKH